MKETDTEPKPPAATIGCGTYLLFALVVYLAVQSALKNVDAEVRGLRSEVRSLRSAVERLSLRAAAKPGDERPEEAPSEKK